LRERNVVAVAKADGRDVDTSGLAKIHRHLLSLAQVRNETALLNAADSLPGVTLTQRVLSCPIRNRAGRPAGVLVLFRSREASEFRRRDAMLSDLLARRAASIVDASYDTLSGLLTHKAFEQRAQVLLAQRAAERGLRWSCLHINTDRMHAINDDHGMHVGDQLLARLGELIRARMVPGALAARIVGGSFAILLPTTEEEAAGFAEALRAGAEALTGAQLGATDASLKASVSIGVATSDESKADLARLLSMADAACTMAEDAGCNRVVLFKAGDESLIRRTGDVDAEPALRAVISNNRLRLDAQLMAPTGGTAAHTPHFELLLRVLDDSGTAVAPGRFMSGAARYQLMPAVDRWVVSETLRQLAPHAQLLASSPVIFNINLSGQSLGEAGFADFIIEQITTSGIPPQAFCFEVAESAAIANLAQAEALMKRLREYGCSMALDNFGTGLSSLSHLRTLPVNMLKIDGSFVRDVLKDPRAESMVQAMAQLAHSMQLTTVAQNVETDEIRLRVARLGVDHGQGFAIARPAPFADALRDLPTYAAVPAQSGGEEAGPESSDDSLSAELQQQLLDAGIALEDDEKDDALAHMEKILAGYDHSESTLYQGKVAR
jgi:Amt family ammonium transporter